jgi:hypothetical protein
MKVKDKELYDNLLMKIRANSKNKEILELLKKSSLKRVYEFLKHNDNELLVAAASSKDKEVFNTLLNEKSRYEQDVAGRFYSAIFENIKDDDNVKALELNLDGMIFAGASLKDIEEVWEAAEGLWELQRAFFRSYDKSIGCLARILSECSKNAYNENEEGVKILKFVVKKIKEANLYDDVLKHFIKHGDEYELYNYPQQTQQLVFDELTEAQIKMVRDDFLEKECEADSDSEPEADSECESEPKLTTKLFLYSDSEEYRQEQMFADMTKAILLRNGIESADPILAALPPGLIPLIMAQTDNSIVGFDIEYMATVLCLGKPKEYIDSVKKEIVNAISALTDEQKNDVIAGNLRANYLQQAIRNKLDTVIGESKGERVEGARAELTPASSKASPAFATSCSSRDVIAFLASAAPTPDATSLPTILMSSSSSSSSSSSASSSSSFVSRVTTPSPSASAVPVEAAVASSTEGMQSPSMGSCSPSSGVLADPKINKRKLELPIDTLSVSTADKRARPETSYVALVTAVSPNGNTTQRD